tara:strand:- start:164 stop:325 length:162 start_codon:yes stop_codon:yes gene_type:complete
VEGGGEEDEVDGEEVLTQTDTYAVSVVVIIGGVIMVGMVPMVGVTGGGQDISL